MFREILKDINLLKKYHHNLVYDYTEYPTKGIWSQEMKNAEYKSAMKEWISQNPKAPVLFYVHTPFCEQLCYYCLCSKEITKDYEMVKSYLYNYLFKEMDLLRDFYIKNDLKPNVEEIYLGGGSPTYYKEPEFEALVGRLRGMIDFDKVKTFTIEVDPRRVDTDRLKFYHKMGVNRLSFGVQDFDPEVQEEINRPQPPELLYNLLTPEIRKLFPVINFDLLIGLPKQTTKSIRKTIELAADIGPSQIQTMYVHYKPNVRKYMMQMVRNVPMPDFYDRKALFVEATEGLMELGYTRAGFESFAKPDDILASAMKEEKALYNSLGTTTGDAINFIAVGSSAHGAFGPYYFQNFYEQPLYKEALDKGEFPVYRGYKLNDEDELRRDVIKRVRTYFKVDIALVEKTYNVNFKQHFAAELNVLREFADDGILTIDDKFLTLTELGQHFSPQVASVFDAYLQREPYNKEVYMNQSLRQVSMGMR